MADAETGKRSQLTAPPPPKWRVYDAGGMARRQRERRQGKTSAMFIPAAVEWYPHSKSTQETARCGPRRRSRLRHDLLAPAPSRPSRLRQLRCFRRGRPSPRSRFRRSVRREEDRWSTISASRLAVAGLKGCAALDSISVHTLVCNKWLCSQQSCQFNPCLDDNSLI